MNDLKPHFGDRLVVLNNGQPGIRAGLRCTVKELSDTPSTLDFVATDETVDRYNEVIRLAGWQLDEYRANPVVVDSHDYSSVLKIIGRSTDLVVTGEKMVNRVEFSMDNPLGKVAFGMARGGFIKSESVGFMPIAWENGKAGQPDRTYTQQNLLEISLVAIPANPGATIGNAIKSGAITPGDVRDLAECLKQFCNQPADLDTNTRALGALVDEAHWLRVQIQLNEIRSVLRRA